MAKWYGACLGRKKSGVRFSDPLPTIKSIDIFPLTEEDVRMANSAKDPEELERQDRIAFWQSLPASERERICIWFAKQFGEIYKTSNPEFKSSRPIPSPPEVPSAPLPKLSLPPKYRKTRYSSR